MGTTSGSENGQVSNRGEVTIEELAQELLPDETVKQIEEVREEVAFIFSIAKKSGRRFVLFRLKATKMHIGGAISVDWIGKLPARTVMAAKKWKRVLGPAIGAGTMWLVHHWNEVATVLRELSP